MEDEDGRGGGEGDRRLLVREGKKRQNEGERERGGNVKEGGGRG